MRPLKATKAGPKSVEMVKTPPKPIRSAQVPSKKQGNSYRRMAKSYYGDGDKRKMYSQLKQEASFKRKCTDITKYAV